jgi:hypothetical protein
VGVLGGGPGPVLAGQLDNPGFALAAARAGVGGAAEHDPAGVLGVAQDAVDRAGGPRQALSGGRRAQVGEAPSDAGYRQPLPGAPVEHGGDPGGLAGVADQPGAGGAHAGFHRVGVGGAFFGVPVGAWAGVVPADGVLLEPFPHEGLEVVPEVLRFGHPHPPDQHGGGLRGLHVDRLAGGESGIVSRHGDVMVTAAIPPAK